MPAESHPQPAGQVGWNPSAAARQEKWHSPGEPGGPPAVAPTPGDQNGRSRARGIDAAFLAPDPCFFMVTASTAERSGTTDSASVSYPGAVSVSARGCVPNGKRTGSDARPAA